MDYIFKSENNSDLFEMELAIESKKIDNALAMVESVYELNCKQAEYKVMSESGTYDDLMDLYEKATEDANEKKTNIFKRAFEMIRTAFQKVIDFISTKFRKLTGNDEVLVDKKTVEATKKLKSLNQKIQQMMVALKQLDWKKIGVLALEILAIVATILGLVKLAKHAKWYNNIVPEIEEENRELDNKYRKNAWTLAVNEDEYSKDYHKLSTDEIEDIIIEQQQIMDKARKNADILCNLAPTFAEQCRRDINVVIVGKLTSVADIFENARKALIDAGGAIRSTIGKLKPRN